ncbi:uncharacterized protein [Solanum lycopersicum]|uniref:uncharacterized protein n=1 Tax=Solanum lycopersicum TaxID=4081 RepID=UPI003748126A
MASRLRDYTRLNPPTFYGSIVEEDPQEFIDEVLKLLLAMGLSTSFFPKETRETKVVEFITLRQGEEARARRKSNDVKRERSFDGSTSKNRLEIQDKPRFKKQVSSHVSSKFPKSSGDRVSNPKFKKGKGTISPTEKLTCGKCGKKQYGDCLKGMDT